ncbi:amidase domain-containing protein [Bacillus alkalicellulosilyticus]|uniref:amidase domain-containing protein n=1 Tax=Alkalihalobacterium alkalicellulosilyticum TaxID=1912214 RepID=UPI0009965E97|nr:amidase domain-containing protein [Bacillus alkalicellulosilyticus]
MERYSEQIERLAEKRNHCFITGDGVEEVFDRSERECFERKRDQLAHRKGEIVKSTVDGRILRQQTVDQTISYDYVIHYQHLIKLPKHFYLEETIEKRRADFKNGKLIKDRAILPEPEKIEETSMDRVWTKDVSNERFTYNRQEAVKYAERWWNDYNPKYKKFNDNCTNYISQCVRAGGVPMTGYPNRSKGWWFRNDNWSYSWSVAHAFRWQLSGATTGLRGQEMSDATALRPGDVICYDFNGDGRWQHTTIVVAKDENGEPLVNAQSTNSRMRYWAYEDSTAWTPKIQYKFFRVLDSN